MKEKGCVSISECRARFSELVNRVESSQRTFTITRRGRPVAKIVPVEPVKRVSLKGSMTFHGDIVSPMKVVWDANR